MIILATGKLLSVRIAESTMHQAIRTLKWVVATSAVMWVLMSFVSCSVLAYWE